MLFVENRGLALAGLICGLGLVCGGCSSFGGVFNRDSDSGLEEVDQLLGSVERAHLECEMSRSESAIALDSLHTIVNPNFRGDAIVGFESLELALQKSLLQAETLRGTTGPMSSAAIKVAMDWEADLANFGTEFMRDKSRARLEQTTAEYLAVYSPLLVACDAYDLFNLGLQDHVLYFGHDMNPAAVAAIEEELVLLTELQESLDAKLDVCMQAAGDYVRGTALSGQLGLPGGAPAAVVAVPEPVPQVGLRAQLAAQ